MAYNDFKLNSLVKQFGLSIRENLDLFADILAVEELCKLL